VSILRDQVLQRIANERIRQLEKWGEQHHTPAEWISVATEELGEAAERANRAGVEPVAGDVILERELLAFLRELVEVAAVCVAAYEDVWVRYPEIARAVTTSRSELSP
jgi:hypothetical protein